MEKKILSALVNLLCVFAILFSLLAAWTVLSTPKGQAPRLFGWSMLTVLTGSMEPTLPEMSLIFVHQVPPETLQPGDIITFYTTLSGREGVLNTHRITEVVDADSGLSFLTKGDANSLRDQEAVPAANVLGRVAYCSVFLGTAVSLLRHPYVFLPLVLIPLLILILRSGLRLYRLAKEEVAQAERELKEELDHDPNDHHRDP